MASQSSNAQLANALLRVLESPNEGDRNGEPANIVDALFALARSVESLAVSVKYLGNGDAGTTMGGMEALGMKIRESAELIFDGLESLAQAEAGRE